MAFLPFLVAFAFTGAVIGDGDVPYKGKEAWGYINVRKDAYMFWWLYYTDIAKNYNDYPLIIWLQGGPGASSCGYGNFQEIGPLDIHLKPRNTTWVKKANLLFLDNPVGSGFSYVTNTSAFAKNNTQIADDLVAVFSEIMKNIPEFQKSPLYIFGESYGGKMAIDFAEALYKATKAGKVSCNLKGVALGDSWISPFDSVSSWGSYLYTMAMISKAELNDLNTQVMLLKQALETGKFDNATMLFSKISDSVQQMTNDVNFYNILKSNEESSSQGINKFPIDHKWHKLYERLVGKFHVDELTALMNGPIKEKLHVIPKNITWGGQSSDVFSALVSDFMKPVTESVDKLLNETSLNVNIYNGQLDLIVDTLGTLRWVETLKWPGLKQFLASPRLSITSKNATEGFRTSFKNLQFFWILKSGHMVPADAGLSALNMLDIILK